MPTIQLRKVGMSYILEGLVESGFDPTRLRDDFAEVYGVALAPISTPRRPDPADIPEPFPIDGLILDRRAETWDGLRDRVEAWVLAAGFSYAAWTGGATSADEPSATLHFHE